MKPGQHPDFFRFPAPNGRTRESTIVLDSAGRFWHDAAPVEKHSFRVALSKWIQRHPDDGRYILSNGYDWTYFKVEDVPFFVEAVRLEERPNGTGILLSLSDESWEPLTPAGMRIGRQDALYVAVKSGHYEARFTQCAQVALAPLLVAADSPDSVGLRVGGKVHWIPLRSPSASAK